MASRDMSAFDLHIDCRGVIITLEILWGNFGGNGSDNSLVNGNQIQPRICRCDTPVVDCAINTNVVVSGSYNCSLDDAAINGY